MDSEMTSEFLSEYHDNRYPKAFTDRYEAMECLSRSPAGETLLVRDKESGKLLVAKCYEKGQTLYESTEPEGLRKLSHPGLPAYEGEFRSDTMRCILREYIFGKTLCEMEKEAPFSQEAVRHTGVELCKILSYLHSQKPPIIHRDIKPQNIIIQENGAPVLIDLGISRLYVEGAGADTVFCGTQDFAPPEQYGFLQTDCRSDIYSLGILLAWMLTGKAAPIREPHTPLERVIAKCAAFAPEKRFRSAAAAERALLETQPSARKGKRILLGVVVILLLVLVAAVFWRQADEPAEAVSAPAADMALSTDVSSKAGFTEPLIEQAVRLMLGKAEDEPISEEELSAVTDLYITQDTVCPNLESFNKAHEAQCREDFNGRGAITSLEDLKRLPNLCILCIASQQIEDISPLSSLPELSHVELRFNDVVDITPLEGLEKLAIVGLNANPVTDISPLAGCENLRNLDLCDAGDYNGSDLARLGNLDFLDISNATDSYLYLGGKTIKELKLSNTGVTELSFLGDVAGLERLEVCYTALSDLSELENHPELAYLKLCEITAEDFSVLQTLPNLKTVIVSADMEAYIEPVAAAGDFSVTYQ